MYPKYYDTINDRNFLDSHRYDSELYHVPYYSDQHSSLNDVGNQDQYMGYIGRTQNSYYPAKTTSLDTYHGPHSQLISGLNITSPLFVNTHSDFPISNGPLTDTVLYTSSMNHPKQFWVDHQMRKDYSDAPDNSDSSYRQALAQFRQLSSDILRLLDSSFTIDVFSFTESMNQFLSIFRSELCCSCLKSVIDRNNYRLWPVKMVCKTRGCVHIIHLSCLLQVINVPSVLIQVLKSKHSKLNIISPSANWVSSVHLNPGNIGYCNIQIKFKHILGNVIFHTQIDNVPIQYSADAHPSFYLNDPNNNIFNSPIPMRGIILIYVHSLHTNHFWKHSVCYDIGHMQSFKVEFQYTDPTYLNDFKLTFNCDPLNFQSFHFISLLYTINYYDNFSTFVPHIPPQSPISPEVILTPIDPPITYSQSPQYDSKTMPKYLPIEYHGHIHEESMKQQGSKDLQTLLSKEEGREDLVNEMIFECKEHLELIIHDTFGNYFIQALFRASTFNQRKEILNYLSKSFYSLCQIKSSSYAIQNMIDISDNDDRIGEIIINSIEKDRILSLVCDSNGTHIIQRCLKLYSHDVCKPIIEVLIPKCVELSSDRNGSMVIRQCLSAANSSEKILLIEPLVPSCKFLSLDPFGNYVIQHIIAQKDKEEDPDVVRLHGELIDGLIPHVSVLAKEKNSSHVVEKCLEFADSSQKEKIIKSLYNKSSIQSLLDTRWGSFVLQKAFGTLAADQDKSVYKDILFQNKTSLSRHGKKMEKHWSEMLEENL